MLSGVLSFNQSCYEASKAVEVGSGGIIVGGGMSYERVGGAEDGATFRADVFVGGVGRAAVFGERSGGPESFRAEFTCKGGLSVLTVRTTTRGGT